MHCRQVAFSLLMCATAGGAWAQGPSPASPIALAVSLQRQQAAILRNLVESAEKMPDADYGYKASLDIRTFGQFIGHVANSQYQLCAAARGEANPNAEDFEKTAGKPALVAALKASGAYCADVYGAITDVTAMETVANGPARVTRAAILASNIAHNNEHYGNLVIYMRIKGLVPPSTERAQPPRKP